MIDDPTEYYQRRNNWELVKYRDIGMSTYTYFWVDQSRKIVSPYFDCQEDAVEWLYKD